MWFILIFVVIEVIFLKTIEMNSLVLAYLGDTIYENYVRKFLIRKGISHVDKLQKEAVKYVSAVSQASYLKKLMDINFLLDEELDVVKRARNYKTTSHPKSCDIITYKYATGLEALIGFLDLENKKDRIDEIMGVILEDDLC